MALVDLESNSGPGGYSPLTTHREDDSDRIRYEATFIARRENHRRGSKPRPLAHPSVESEAE